MTFRLAAFYATTLIVGALGCAQGVTTSEAAGNGGTSSTGGSGGTTSTGGTGGASTTSSTGTGGAPSSCSTANDCKTLNDACNVGDCVNAKCVTKPANDGKSCDDENGCTNGDTCSQGKCVGITKSCGQASTCHIAMCNQATGECEEMPGDDGAQCDDKDACTYFGMCQNGVCTKGEPVDCSLFDTDCTQGVCDPVSGCKSVPAFEGKACDDGLFCTVKTVCKGGTCGGGQPNPCVPAGSCFIGMCDEANQVCTSVPGNDGAACDDGSPCTANTKCSAGACAGGVPSNDGMACDDGVSCTSGTTCSAGTCAGGMGPTIYFADDFSSNAAGWLLGPEWEIGPTKEGNSMGFSFPDPAEDHSASPDNGVAGTVLGGDVTINPHGYEYIESPPFDTSQAQGKVILGYYRWVNTDSAPAMHSRVEVWNGNQWITVWASGDFFMEFEWTYVEHDITNYKNAAMKVRFGFDVKDIPFDTFSGWNIDDVLVASQACP